MKREEDKIHSVASRQTELAVSLGVHHGNQRQGFRARECVMKETMKGRVTLAPVSILRKES